MLRDVWVARFWARAERVQSDCWEWAGSRNTLGYGRIGTRLAHRVAWELSRGPIPRGSFVCHRCDNPPCVNPDHLFLGTHRDNMADMMAKRAAGVRPRPRSKGRRGESNPLAKLSEDDVAELRAERERDGTSYRELARRFGVSKSQAQRIACGKSWANIQS